MQAERYHRFIAACLISFFGIIAWVALAHPALAQAGGDFGNFTCIFGTASGTLYDQGASCPSTLTADHIFSFVVCNMERIASNLISAMFCGLLDTAIPAVTAAVTLAVIIFGMAFTMGVIPATAREFQLFMLKMAIVWVFATQADMLIGFGYNFLVTTMREGIVIVLSNVMDAEGGALASGPDLYRYLDTFLGKVLGFATSTAGVDWSQPSSNLCQNAVFAVIATMAIVFPPLAYLAVALIFKIALTFLRAVFGYVYALMALVFMLAMAPLFLSFALFRQTQPFFNKYIGYLASFTLQMVIVFAFLGAIVSIDVKHITRSFVDIIMPVQETKETESMRWPWEFCTVCDFKVVHVDTGAEIASDQYKDFINKGKLVCKTPKKAISPTQTIAPDPSSITSTTQVQSTLMKFTATALLSLFVLAYVVDKILTLVPMLAQTIVAGMGGGYAPQLGGGEAITGRPVVHMPGDSLINTFEHGFADGYANSMRTSSTNNTISASIAGFKEASQRLLVSGRSGDPEITNRISGNTNDDPGLVSSFIDFIVRPNGN